MAQVLAIGTLRSVHSDLGKSLIWVATVILLGCDSAIVDPAQDAAGSLELRFLSYASTGTTRRGSPDELVFVTHPQDGPFLIALWSKGGGDAELRSVSLTDGSTNVVTISDWVHIFGARGGEWIGVRSRTGRQSFYLNLATLELTGTALDIPPDYNGEIPRVWGDTVLLVADAPREVTARPHPDETQSSLYIHDIGEGAPRLIVDQAEGMTAISPELLERQLVLTAQRNGGLCTQIRRPTDGGIVKEWYWEDPEIPVLGLDPGGQDVPKRASGSFAFAKIDDAWHLVDAGHASIARPLNTEDAATAELRTVWPLRDLGFGDSLGRAFWLAYFEDSVELQSCGFDDAVTTAITELPHDFRAPIVAQVGDRWYLIGACAFENRRPTVLVAIDLNNPADQVRIRLPEDRAYVPRDAAGQFLIFDARDGGIWIADLKHLGLD